MKTNFLTFLAAFAISASATFDINAYSVPLVVDVKLALQRDGGSSTNGSVASSSIEKVAVATVDLLKLLADALAVTLPADARLILVDYDHFEIRDANNAILYDDFHDILDYEYGDFLEKGKQNTDTDQQTFTYVFLSHISFDDGSGNNFEFRGVTEEKYSNTAPNGDGIVKAKDSIKITGSGDGQIDGGLIILTGQVTGKGSASFL